MEYSLYRLKPIEKLGIIAISIGATLLVSYLFYNSWLGIFASPIIYILIQKEYKTRQIQKRLNQITAEFIEALRSISNAMSAGYSMENACIEAQKELELLYGIDSNMYQEMVEINRSQRMSVPLEKSIEEFAVRTDIEDIMSFAQIFNFAKRNGGSMVEIIESTTYKISAKYETQKEIEVAIAAKKMEQKVMCGFPVLIITYLRLTSPDYLCRLYGNSLGIAFMTGCLAVYAAALLLGKRIMDIKV